jgi:UDP-2,4-diacetamido-2,4,6-trideoxy-beta-L-altropyranose hydrolase
MVHRLPNSGSTIFQDETLSPVHSDWLGCDWQTDANACSDIISDLVDWIIVDHYALDYRWESVLRDKCHHMMCIDDLADRTHDCDVLLDQSLGRTANDYRQFVSVGTRLLLGPQYALLRPEFIQWRDTSLARRQNSKLRHILVTMGGVDRDNVTGRVLKILKQCRLDTLERITVVLGPLAPWRNEVISCSKEMPVSTNVLSGIDNIAELMAFCDLVIGAGGTSSWERCSLGVPSVLVVLADNQRHIASQLSKAKTAFIIDDINVLELSLLSFLESADLSDKLYAYSCTSAEISDAKGVDKTITELSANYG